MPQQSTVLPTILIPGFAGDTCLELASKLISKGYQVIAVCHPGDAQAIGAAKDAGCAIAEAWREQALRTGLTYFEETVQGLHGVVVVNAGESYSSDDVLAVAEALRENPNKFIIASRRVGKDTGFWGRLVKRFAAFAMAAVHGRQVKDPWAGLRAIPSSFIHPFLDIQGDGRKYAFNMVLNLHHKGAKAVSVPVAAQYSAGEGQESRERVKDLFKILVLPLKFVSASLTATATDYAVYILISRLVLPGHEYLALTASRGTGAVTGYLLNRNVVFKRKNNTRRKELVAALQFALLAAFNYGAAWLLLRLLHDVLGIHDIAARLMSDALLFVFSYMIQREFIFHHKAPNVK